MLHDRSCQQVRRGEGRRQHDHQGALVGRRQVDQVGLRRILVLLLTLLNREVVGHRHRFPFGPDMLTKVLGSCASLVRQSLAVVGGRCQSCRCGCVACFAVLKRHRVHLKLSPVEGVEAPVVREFVLVVVEPVQCTEALYRPCSQ